METGTPQGIQLTLHNPYQGETSKEHHPSSSTALPHSHVSNCAPTQNLFCIPCSPTYFIYDREQKSNQNTFYKSIKFKINSISYQVHLNGSNTFLQSLSGSPSPWINCQGDTGRYGKRILFLTMRRRKEKSSSVTYRTV